MIRQDGTEIRNGRRPQMSGEYNNNQKTPKIIDKPAPTTSVSTAVV